MITVEKALRDAKTRKATGEQTEKKKSSKRLLIGLAVVGLGYAAYKIFFKKHESIQSSNP